MSSAIHVAAGFALFFHWSTETREGGRNTAGRSEVLVVNLIPLDSEHVSGSETSPPRNASNVPGEQLLRDTSGGTDTRSVAETRLTGSSSKTNSAEATSSPSTATASSVPAGELLAYRTRLQDHLSRYRTYPAAARDAGKAGVVYVRFVIDHDGRVLDVWIESSSGTAEIDREAMASIARAQPLPTPPSAWPDRLSISLPITFQIG